MCLGVPAEVLRVYEEEGVRYADVKLGGGSVKVLLPLDDVKPGDYVIVHAGIAISKIEEDQLEDALTLWREVETFLRGDDRA